MIVKKNSNSKRYLNTTLTNSIDNVHLETSVYHRAYLIIGNFESSTEVRFSGKYSYSRWGALTYAILQKDLYFPIFIDRLYWYNHARHLLFVPRSHFRYVCCGCTKFDLDLFNIRGNTKLFHWNKTGDKYYPGIGNTLDRTCQGFSSPWNDF